MFSRNEHEPSLWYLPDKRVQAGTNLNDYFHANSILHSKTGIQRMPIKKINR